MHDWTRVGDWVFAHFRLHWLVELSHALKSGLLPDMYYPMIQWVGGKRHKRLAIRHTSDDRVVAIVEIVSPGNKAGETEFKRFVGKAVRAIRTAATDPVTPRRMFAMPTLPDEERECGIVSTTSRPSTASRWRPSHADRHAAAGGRPRHFRRANSATPPKPNSRTDAGSGTAAGPPAVRTNWFPTAAYPASFRWT